MRSRKVKQLEAAMMVFAVASLGWVLFGDWTYGGTLPRGVASLSQIAIGLVFLGLAFWAARSSTPAAKGVFTVAVLVKVSSVIYSGAQSDDGLAALPLIAMLAVHGSLVWAMLLSWSLGNGSSLDCCTTHARP
jgi:hypothetical protein